MFTVQFRSMHLYPFIFYTKHFTKGTLLKTGLLNHTQLMGCGENNQGNESTRCKESNHTNCKGSKNPHLGICTNQLAFDVRTALGGERMGTLCFSPVIMTPEGDFWLLLSPDACDALWCVAVLQGC